MLKIMGYNGTLDEVKGFTMVKMSEHEHAITYNATDEVDKVYKPHILWSLQLDVDVDYLRPDYIICYTNIVSPTVIGSLYSKILRSNLDSVFRFTLTDKDGNNIDLNGGNVLITLLLYKKDDFSNIFKNYLKYNLLSQN